MILDVRTVRGPALVNTDHVAGVELRVGEAVLRWAGGGPGPGAAPGGGYTVLDHAAMGFATGGELYQALGAYLGAVPPVPTGADPDADLF